MPSLLEEIDVRAQHKTELQLARMKDPPFLTWCGRPLDSAENTRAQAALIAILPAQICRKA